jgi:hypothetical protein
MDTDSIIAARAFTRDLNILLKTVQIYGFDHGRTVSAFETTWSELRAALECTGEAGLLLSFSVSGVLLDGVPIDGTSADRSFAQWLSSAGLSCIHFSSRVTSDDLARFVRVFASGGPLGVPLTAQLKSALAEKGEPTVRINDIPLVAKDDTPTDAGPATEVTTPSQRTEPKDVQTGAQAPQGLLPLLAPAEGAEDGSAAAERTCSGNTKRAPLSLEVADQCAPVVAHPVGPHIRTEDSLSELLEAALCAPQVPAGVVELIQRFPVATLEQLASRLGHCKRRDERHRVVTLSRELGEDGLAELRRVLIIGQPQKAVFTVALLSWLQPRALEEQLPGHLGEWEWTYHDQVVRQLACGGAPERGKLLVNLLGALDPVVLPEALDEIGMCGDRIASPKLLSMLQEVLLCRVNVFLGIKIVEALGRLRTRNACPLLRDLVAAKRLWRWRYPRELRITAVQVLQKVEPEWTRNFLPKSGITRTELVVSPLDPTLGAPWARQRRYERVQLSHPLPAMAKTAQSDCPIEVERLSLGGGAGTTGQDLRAGTIASFNMRPELGRVQAEILVRDAQPQQVSFELISVEPEDRTRIRRILAGQIGQTSQVSVYGG